jgi:hypothetical protein
VSYEPQRRRLGVLLTPDLGGGLMRGNSADGGMSRRCAELSRTTLLTSHFISNFILRSMSSDIGGSLGMELLGIVYWFISNCIFAYSSDIIEHKTTTCKLRSLIIGSGTHLRQICRLVRTWLQIPITSSPALRAARI